LSRVINPNDAAKERTQLTRGIVLALRELMRQAQPDEHTRDLAAFISLALAAIFKTIDSSVTAWEKRGYWLKADRFRMEWTWCDTQANALQKALLADDWLAVAKSAAAVAEKLKDVLDISVTGKFSLVGFTSDQRRHIGTISKANSKEKQSWYKRIDLGEEMGNVVFDNWSQIEDSTNLKTVLQKLIDWIIQ